LRQVKNALFIMRIHLDPIKKEYLRETYNLYDFFSDIGGVLEFIVAFFSLFTTPFATFLYKLKALELLYLLRTKSRSFLSQDYEW
jgi:hypothetical protein